MPTETQIKHFLEEAGWRDFHRQDLAADFSTRQFARLSRTGSSPSSAILMCAAPEQKTEAFVFLSSLLRRCGLAAPEVYASDVGRGIVLMQDFGDCTVGRALDTGRVRAAFEGEAAGILATLHAKVSQAALSEIETPLFNAALFTEQLGVFLEFYFPVLFHRGATPEERSAFAGCWRDVLSPLDVLPRSLLLRDFMPDNLMVLPEPVLGQTLGLLDFQDAGYGCIAYDLASWCEDVRRDGGADRLEPFVKQYHVLNPDVDFDVLLSAARIYAAQRHIRILGLLVKLGRAAYVPRVWGAVQTFIEDPALAPVRRWFSSCASSAEGSQ